MAGLERLCDRTSRRFRQEEESRRSKGCKGRDYAGKSKGSVHQMETWLEGEHGALMMLWQKGFAS